MKHRAPKGGPYFRGEHAYGSESKMGFEWTGEFRAPLKGEFYLSGAEPIAWRAPNDLGTEFYIMRKVEGPRKEVVVDGFVYRLADPPEQHRGSRE